MSKALDKDKRLVLSGCKATTNSPRKEAKGFPVSYFFLKVFAKENKNERQLLTNIVLPTLKGSQVYLQVSVAFLRRDILIHYKQQLWL